MLDKPQVTPGGFTVRVPPKNLPGHAGGQLTARVLLPKHAQINAIGGAGFQFFVDGKNYDENGKLEAIIAKLGPHRDEPGAWRIEVRPPVNELTDDFLVVLLPSAFDAVPTHRIRLLESENKVGCEIIGPKRTTRWWFEPGRDEVEITVASAGQRHHYHVQGPARTEPAPPSLLDGLKYPLSSK